MNFLMFDASDSLFSDRNLELNLKMTIGSETLYV